MFQLIKNVQNYKVQVISSYLSYFASDLLQLPLGNALLGIWNIENADGIWYIHAIISMLFLTLLLLYCIAVKISQRDRMLNSNVGFIKFSIFPDLCSLFIRYGYCLLYIISPGSYDIALSILEVVLFGLILLHIKSNYYYHSIEVASLYTYCYCHLFLISLMQLYAYVSTSAHNLTLYLFSFVASLVMLWSISDYKSTYISQNLKDFFGEKLTHGSDSIIILQFLQRITASFSTNRRNLIVFVGINHMHHKYCKKVDCPLNQIAETMISNHELINNIEKTNYAFNSMINMLYQTFIAKYKFHQLSIDYIAFLAHSPSSTSLASFEIQKINRKSLSIINRFDYELLIMRIEHNKANLILSSLSGIEKVIQYQNHYAYIKHTAEDVAKLFQSYYNRAVDDTPNVQQMMELLRQISNLTTKIEKNWEKMQEIDNENSKAIKFYSYFLYHILNDYEQSKNLYEFLDKLKGKHSVLDALKNALNLHKRSKYTKKDIPCIFVTTQLSRVGYITDCNLAACRMLGVEKKKLIDKHMSTVIPQIYHKNHIIEIEKSLNGMKKANDKEIFGFVKHISGYLIPITKRFAELPSVMNCSNFIITLEESKKIGKAAYVLADTTYKIQGISFFGKTMLGLTPLIIQNGAIITSLCPDITNISLDKEDPTLVQFDLPPSSLSKSHSLLGKIELLTSIFTISMSSQLLGYRIQFEFTTCIAQEPLNINKKLKCHHFIIKYDEDTNRYIRDYKEGESEGKLLSREWSCIYTFTTTLQNS